MIVVKLILEYAQKHHCTDSIRKLSDTNEFELIKSKLIE